MVDDPLRSDDDDDAGGDAGYLRWLFHTTSYAAVEQIAQDGLRPRAGGGVFQHGGYDIHSQGKIFMADGGAALEWFGKVEDQLAHHAADDGDLEERIAEIVPVMLRIDLDAGTQEPEIDELGSRDVRGGVAYYVTKRIKPAAIEYWDPTDKAWLPIEDALPDARLGVAEIEYYDEDGGVVDEDDWDGETPPGIRAIGPYDRGGFKPAYQPGLGRARNYR